MNRSTESTMQCLQLDEASKFKKGVFIKKKNLAILAIIVASIFIGSIIATHYGTKSSSRAECHTQLPPMPTSHIPAIKTTKSPTGPKVNYRLSTDIKPFFYELEIQPFIGDTYGIDSFKYIGKMTMHLKCLNPTNKITFHMIDLAIDHASLELSSMADPALTFSRSTSTDTLRDFYTISLDRKCRQNTDYKLVVPFTGVILEKLYGFYRSSYTENGTTYHIASTDFEPTDARRAFPCFDEPAMKAQFQLTMIRHKNFTTSLFNAPLISSIPHPSQPGWMIDRFDKSEKMSTYLVAFVVSNFKKTEMKSPKYGVDIAVAGRPAAIEAGEGELALNEAAKMIDFYSDYFGVAYPMAKSTQVAIPDFNSGAMENWGLVFYREASLLYNEATDTIKNKRRVSEVVAHELAHQWNGNLVTMEWWNDIWWLFRLNEGFASWIEVIGMNHTHPEWRDLDYFFVEKLSVLEKDSYESSHPINFEVMNPSEIGGLFDDISYDKGSSIIRMMNAFLTEATFRKGVSNYLTKYKYGNAVQDNLWSELTKQAHLDGTLDPQTTVKEIMDTWTLQKGYPIVHVNRTAANQVVLTQDWFLLNPFSSVKKTSEFNKHKWYVPFTFTTKQERDFNFEKATLWMNPRNNKLSIALENTSEQDWLVGNVKHAGFYRVNYDETNWLLLIDQLKSNYSLIDSTSRATLLDDAFNLGRAEFISQSIFLELVSYLPNEVEGVAFTAAFNGLKYFYDMLSGEYVSFKLFQDYYVSLVEKTYERLGWDLSLQDVNDISLQTYVLTILCRSGHEACVSQARMFYANWLNENSPIPPNFKDIIYSTVIEWGDENDWNQLFNLTKITNIPSEKLRMLKALTKSKDLGILIYLLSQASDEAIVKKQDQASLVERIGMNSYGRRLAFDYLDKNWDELLDKYGSVAFTLPRMVKTITGNMNSKFDVEKIKRFVADHPNLGIAAPAWKEAAEKAESNTRWMERNLRETHKWLVEKMGA